MPKQKPGRYYQMEEGEWSEAPTREQCCDCGLVHDVEYRVFDKKGGSKIKKCYVEQRVWRNDKATKGIRSRSQIYVKREKA